MDTSAVENIGPGYSAPVPMKIVAPKFSDEARTAKYQGICVLSLVVDTEGMPRNIRVKRALGMGLDEKAIEAVQTISLQTCDQGWQASHGKCHS